MKIRGLALALAVVACPGPGGILSGADLLRVGGGIARPEAVDVRIPVTGTHDEPLQAFSVSLWILPGNVTVTSVEPGAAVLPLEPEYVQVQIDESLGNVSVGVIFEINPPYELISLPASPVVHQELLTLLVNVLPGATPGPLPLELADGPGELPVKNVFTVLGESRFPALENGTLEVLSRGFRRGYINQDTRLDISDTIYLFSWLFTGGPGPECEAAADTNGNGSVDLSDGIWLLGFVFRGGPPPPEPFQTCGEPPPGVPPLPCAYQAACF